MQQRYRRLRARCAAERLLLLQFGVGRRGTLQLLVQRRRRLPG